MKPSRLLIAVALALTGCTGVRQAGTANQPQTDTIVIRSGGHVRPVLETLIPLFQLQTGMQVRYLVGGSGKMLAEAIEKQDTDAYIAADLRHVHQAEKQNCVAQKIPLITLRPTIAVQRGNPRNIEALADLARPGLQVFTEPPTGCQLGDATRLLLQRHDLEIQAPTVRLDGHPPSLRTFPALITSGRLDAAIVWDSMAQRLRDCVDTVSIPENRNVSVDMVGIVFRESPNPTVAIQFLNFLANKTNRRVWQHHGFECAGN
ncbi:MAG: substrate-binding domain-containing protein [Kiritimatiellales bacterium]|nr:substrate-binding domain-containing protein [Kiritimatiellales bacterium]